MEVDGKLPMKLSDTAQIAVKFGPGQRPLLDLIDGWCGHVMKMFVDLDESESAETDWTVHDLIASMYLRDAIDRGLRLVANPAAGISIAAVDTADEVFRSITAEDRRGLLARFDPDVPTSPWWWLRVPVRGPIALEFQSLIERLD